jgi:hypothetical protein
MLPPLRHCPVLFCLVFLLAPLAASQQMPSRPPPAQADQEQIVPYWTTETGWKSELQLRNNKIGSDLTVTPVLRTAYGAETTLSAVTIKPQEVKSIDLDAAIGTTAPQLVGTYGSLALRYRSPGSRSLYAALMVRNIGHPFAFHIDATGESQDLQAGSREGVWWLPKDTTSDYLILTNQGKITLPLDLSLYDANGKESKQKVLLGPHETMRYSVRKLILAAGLSGSYGGIKVSAASHAGSLDTVHFLFDDTAAFSAILKMFDHDPNAKLDERDFARTSIWTLRAPMLALSNPDPALAFPPGTSLHPQLLIRNTTSNPVDAALRFNWRANSTSGKATGPALHLNPYETRRIDVAGLQNSGLLPKQANWTSVTLTTNSHPDEVVAVAASFDDTLRYGAQTPFTDQLSFLWKGGMWEYDAYHSSIITAGNGGAKPTLAAFTLFYNQGAEKYELEQTLQPDEQMWIDVGKLIREHVPDKNGNTLPADLSSGSFEVRDLTDTGIGSLFEGKLIYDKTYGHVTYGCSLCCGHQTPGFFGFNPLGIPLFGDSQNQVWAYNPCLDFNDDVTNWFYPNWSTGNTAIATVNTSGLHHGVSVGSTGTNTWGNLATTTYRTCPVALFVPPTGGDNVMQLSCSSVTRGSSTTCSISNIPSGATFSNWSFKDSNNNTVTSNTTNSSWAGKMVTGGTVSVKVTASSGSTILSASVTVTNRNWHTNAASPAKVTNGTFATLPVPPQPQGNNSGLGISLERTGNAGFGSTFISDGGPNNGYGYYATQPTFTPLLYQYEINPDLENTGSTFYLSQCGNYNATTNPGGYISGSSLLTQTNRHEYNSTTESHYAFYSNSISTKNNPGDYVESRIAVPGTTATTFDNATSDALNNSSTGIYAKILADFSVEPYPVNYSEIDVFLGNINYAPYTACH